MVEGSAGVDDGVTANEVGQTTRGRLVDTKAVGDRVPVELSLVDVTTVVVD
jgi:hypothetical protein